MKTTGNVLVIGDCHIPFEHRSYLDFCIETQKKYNCSLVYQVGDLVDHHSISTHDHSPDGYSPFQERERSVKKLKRWHKAFPKMKVCIGNHDERIEKAAWKYGLSSTYFKKFEEIYEFPKKWEYAIDHYIYGIRIFHGMGYGGQYAHRAAAMENQQSVVMGHLHSNAGTMWCASEGHLIFGMAVGCGIDRHSWAFRYGRDLRRKPILGVGVIQDSGHKAFFVPMRM